MAASGLQVGKDFRRQWVWEVWNKLLSGNWSLDVHQDCVICHERSMYVYTNPKSCNHRLQAYNLMSRIVSPYATQVIQHRPVHTWNDRFSLLGAPSEIKASTGQTLKHL